MNQAIPDCLVTGYASLLPGLTLPDPNDRHVLAAAIRCGAKTIVTFNLRDFPTSILERYDLQSKHPDDFIVETLHLNPVAVTDAVKKQQSALKNPPRTLDDLLETLHNQRLPMAVAKLRTLLS